MRSTESESKSERIEVRATPSMKTLLQDAAACVHKNVTDFMLEAALTAAEAALTDRRVFRIDADRWAAFQEALNRPVSRKPRLERLLNEKSVIE